MRFSEPNCHRAANWTEFVCWTVGALVPLLYWANGPAVSPDQFVVRWALVVVAVGGAVILRIAKLAGRKKAAIAQKEEVPP